MVNIPSMVVALGLAKSNGAAKDLIKSGAIALDGEKVSDFRVTLDAAQGKVLKVGKHQFRKLVG
jgi:tyrosyl-tRNA synthetase